jgi:hypothetical protein
MVPFPIHVDGHVISYRTTSPLAEDPIVSTFTTLRDYPEVVVNCSLAGNAGEDTAPVCIGGGSTVALTLPDGVT